MPRVSRKKEEPVIVPPQPQETIVKFKIKGQPDQFEGSEVLYTRMMDGHLVECKVEITESPHPDLFAALSRLLSTVIAVVRLSQEDWEEGWISGITIKESGVVITAQADFGDGRCIVNTPFLKYDQLQESLIREVERQTSLYLHGKRAQLSLLEDAA